MTFKNYVNIDSNVQTDEPLIETLILAKLQRRLIHYLEKEEEEEAEEANAIEPNVCSLADDLYHCIIFP